MNLVLTSPILALPAALIGGALVALVILRLGRKTFSARLFGIAIACGAMVAFLPAALGVIDARLHLALPPIWDATYKAFILAGLAEEGAKLAAGYFLIRPYYERRTPRDLILGVAAVALGFALLENVFYVSAAAERWQATALTRMATAVPIHALIGLVLGSGLARADAAQGRATRLALIARAWFIAALLHGFYDFPLMVGSHAPLYPTPINQLALVFSATTPTLLSAFYLAAIGAVCIGATRVIVGLSGKAGLERSSAIAARPLWPNWLDRLVFARATGLALGALLLIPAAIWVALLVNATLVGVMPVLTMEALSICVASAMLGVLLLLRAKPKPAAPLPASGKRRILAFGAIAAVAVIAAGIVIFSGAIETARRNALAYMLLISGGAYGGLGDLDGAIGNYNSALLYKPDFLPALVQRALVNKSYQRYERTLDDLNNAARIAPDDPTILGERANAFENLHQPEKAIADLDHALTIKPDEPVFLSVRAEIRMNEGDFDKAAADLDRALQLKPDQPFARSARGELYLLKYDYENALHELDAAISLDPNSSSPYFTRGRVHFFRGEFPAAVTDLQQSLARQRDPYPALWLYLARGRTGQNGRDELIFWANALPRNAWPFPLIEFYLGARPAPLVYSVAANADQACEADFYVGEWLVQQRLDGPAIERLRRAVATCPKSFIEHGGAVADLNRLAPAAAPLAATPSPSASPTEATPNAPAGVEAVKPAAHASIPASELPTPTNPPISSEPTKTDANAVGAADKAGDQAPPPAASGQGHDAN